MWKVFSAHWISLFPLQACFIVSLSILPFIIHQLAFLMISFTVHFIHAIKFTHCKYTAEWLLLTLSHCAIWF